MADQASWCVSYVDRGLPQRMSVEEKLPVTSMATVEKVIWLVSSTLISAHQRWAQYCHLKSLNSALLSTFCGLVHKEPYPRAIAAHVAFINSPASTHHRYLPPPSTSRALFHLFLFCRPLTLFIALYVIHTLAPFYSSGVNTHRVVTLKLPAVVNSLPHPVLNRAHGL